MTVTRPRVYNDPGSEQNSFVSWLIETTTRGSLRWFKPCVRRAMSYWSSIQPSRLKEPRSSGLSLTGRGRTRSLLVEPRLRQLGGVAERSRTQGEACPGCAVQVYLKKESFGTHWKSKIEYNLTAP